MMLSTPSRTIVPVASSMRTFDVSGTCFTKTNIFTISPS